MKLKNSGRGFTCSSCPAKTRALRRCQEERENFTRKDGNLWPLRIHRTGTPFSFCPGKATWDREAVRTFGLLMVAAETGAMLESGGLASQPDWWVETLTWFLPVYDLAKFASRVRSVLGGKGKSGTTVGEKGAAVDQMAQAPR